MTTPQCNAAEPSLLSKVMWTPVTIVTAPMHLVANIAHRAFFHYFGGYLLRIGIFAHHSKQHSWIKRKIIDIFLTGPRAYFSSDFSEARLAQSHKALKAIGATFETIKSKDKNALDTMMIKYSDIKQTIESNGGQILEGVRVMVDKRKEINRDFHTVCHESTDHRAEYANVIVPDEANAQFSKWASFSSSTLSQLKLERVEISFADGTKKTGYINWAAQDGKRPTPGTVFAHFNSPGERYIAAKRAIMRLALLGCDVYCCDPPGTGNSAAVAPSEGGYYLSAEASIQTLIDKGYDPKKIWIDGFCLGGAVGAHAFKKFHHLGINFFGQNNFDRMLTILSTLPYPIDYLVPTSLPTIFSEDPAMRKLVEEDGLDTLHKLDQIKHEKKNGHVVFVDIDNDKRVSLEAKERLTKGFENVALKVDRITRHHPNPKVDGHVNDVLADKRTWQRAINCITNQVTGNA